jgi:hypothetical protein
MKKIVGIGCSHGESIDPVARAGVLAFVERFQPDTRVHLGDCWDFACLRSGARGASLDNDRGRRPQPDLDAGIEWVRDYRPTHFLFGNHEARVVQLSRHWEGATAHYAQLVLDQMTGALDSVGSVYRKEWSLTTHYKFGDYKFLHGTLYGAQFLKKTAGAIGNCVIAHAHHPGMVTAERSDGARAYSPGCLRTIDSAEYAKERAATLAWGHGIVWGEYDDRHCYLWLHQPTPTEQRTGWKHFPV